MPKNYDDKDWTVAQNAAKTLFANIRFASIDDPIKALAITSSVPNEGKTTVAVNLAQAIATSGATVLLVETDMRRRSLGSVMHTRSRAGVYAVLSGQMKLKDAVIAMHPRGLYFLDAEPHIPNPADLIASNRFKSLVQLCKQQYDYVIFDTPPVGAFVDAAVLSTLVDGVVMVVREDFVRREELQDAYAQLEKAGANVIGIAMNDCKAEQHNYYYYSYYKRRRRP